MTNQFPGVIIKNNEEMPYPRVCAHRGFSAVAPESTMAAFGAAVAIGCEEVEMDLWQTADGVIVSSHDDGLERVSDGTSILKNYTYAELRTLDFGSKFSPEFEGTRIASFEEILQHYAGRVIMNLHLRHEEQGEEFLTGYIGKIVSLIEKYGDEKYCYFMASNIDTLRLLQRIAPHIERCAGEEGGKRCDYLLEKALETGCTKIQLFSPFFNRYREELGQDCVGYMVEKAHKCGVICNLCIADDPELTKDYLAKGVDTLLTNRAQLTQTLRDRYVKANAAG